MLVVAGLGGLSVFSALEIYKLRAKKQRVVDEVWSIPRFTLETTGTQIVHVRLPTPKLWYVVHAETYVHELVARTVKVPPAPKWWNTSGAVEEYVDVPVLRKALMNVGECLYTPAFKHFGGMYPAKDVSYAPSEYDRIETFTTQGETLARLLPQRVPNICLRSNETYTVSVYNGPEHMNMCFLGTYQEDGRFMFSRLSRDVQSLRQAEIAARQVKLNNAEARLWAYTLGCGMAAALVVLRTW